MCKSFDIQPLKVGFIDVSFTFLRENIAMKMPKAPTVEQAYEILGLQQDTDVELVKAVELAGLNEALKIDDPRERIQDVASFICAADVISIADTTHIKEGAFERIGYDPVANAFTQANKLIVAYDSPSGFQQWETLMRDVKTLCKHTKAIDNFEGHAEKKLKEFGLPVPKIVGAALSSIFAVWDSSEKISNETARSNTYIEIIEGFKRILQYGEDLHTLNQEDGPG